MYAKNFLLSMYNYNGLFSDQCLPVFHGIGTVIPVLKLLVKNLVVGKLAVEQ